MTDLLELLDDAVGEVEPGFGPQEIMRRVRRRRRSRRVAAGMVLIVLTATVVAFATLDGKTAANRVRVVSPASSTPDVLVFDEAGGLLSVDVTTHLVRYDPIYGWKGGDPPFDSLRVGNDAVVGWGDVYAAPLSGAPATRLGTGVFVPAVEPGAVWLTSYGKVQTPTERLVDMNGRVILESPAPVQSGSSSSKPAITGIPGGLVLQTSTGLDIWDARTASITRHLGTTTGSAAPAFGSLLAWCDQCNRSLELTDLASGITRSIAAHTRRRVARSVALRLLPRRYATRHPDIARRRDTRRHCHCPSLRRERCERTGDRPNRFRRPVRVCRMEPRQSTDLHHRHVRRW